MTSQNILELFHLLILQNFCKFDIQMRLQKKLNPIVAIVLEKVYSLPRCK